MTRHPLFLDDQPVADALDKASDAAFRHLSALLPDPGTPEGARFRCVLRKQLAAMLTGHAGELPPLVHGEDAFGDRFAIEALPLPRTGTGYAVQMLDTDTLLDRHSGTFLGVRDTALDGLFASFDEAYAAARTWLEERRASVDDYPLAIVPAQYDETMHRHVLIYGVLTRHP